jgi:hypothetical protein
MHASLIFGCFLLVFDTSLSSLPPDKFFAAAAAARSRAAAHQHTHLEAGDV